jgi:hypothetical protein
LSVETGDGGDGSSGSGMATAEAMILTVLSALASSGAELFGHTVQPW